MTALGQMLLLSAFVVSGWAAFACIAGRPAQSGRLCRSGVAAGAASLILLSGAAAILVWALLARDFGLKYVAQYSSRELPWHYAISAFWVGQAGSLLLWAWMLALLAVAFLFWPGREPSPLRGPAFGLLMAFLCLLVGVMIFAADPMEPSLSAPGEGAGLSPLLQHPAMLIHPPVVFLGYAGWAVPFALAVCALFSGKLDAEWVRESRPWALFSWLVLGAGILLGADWAYEELGWGGYWAWDPVENGSLIPWLTGTALIHTMMVWQYRRGMKKTALALAVATFGLCNFATFLTRSGIFSSLHAFSRSPIGWIFLGEMVLLLLGGIALIAWRRKSLGAEVRTASIWTRETMVAIATTALLLLAAVALVGTAWVPLSDLFLGRKVIVGTAFYNNVLIPTGLVLLLATAPVPLLRWGKPPTGQQRRGLAAACVVAVVAVVVALVAGLRHPIALAVAGTSALTVAALAGALVLDGALKRPAKPWLGILPALRVRRRQYAGFLIHLGLVCLAIGVAGTSLCTRRHEVAMHEGETVTWAGHHVRYAGLVKRTAGKKHVVEARLEVTPPYDSPYTLLPAQHHHALQNEWTTEVAIHSTWLSDFYTILHYGESEEGVT